MIAAESPVKEIERHTVIATDLIRAAEEHEAASRRRTAKNLRRRAAGHKAAATRIARLQGWV